MAAYEVLLLNTAIPQIQAAQSGDTYVVPRDIAINATAIISANSATDALRITQTGAGNALLVEDSANPDSTPFVVTAAGDVGVGTNSPTQPLSITRGASVAAYIDVAGGGRTLGTNSFTFGQASDGVVTFFQRENAAMYWATNSTERMRLDSSGNLGLGVTPSGWGGTWRALEGSFGQSWFYSNVATITGLVSNAFHNGTNWIYKTANAALRYELGTAADHRWYTAPSGTAGNAITFTQAMTLDASGRLGLGGSTSPSVTLDVGGTSGTLVRIGTSAGNGSTNFFPVLVGDGSTAGGGTNQTFVRMGRFSNGTAGIDAFEGGVGNAPLAFGTFGTERARITSGGYFKASNNGTYQNSTSSYHEIRQSTNTDTVYISNAHVTDPYGVGIAYVNATPNGTGNNFLYCSDATANRLSVRSNGGLANYQANNVNLSDQRTKKDIVAAPSYWDKIKGIEIVHFKYKDQTHDDNNVGVIAQQVEQVAPEFVDQDGWGETPEDGVPLKSIYTSDMYHAAIKALQEAMARIETLEAEVAALKGA